MSDKKQEGSGVRSKLGPMSDADFENDALARPSGDKVPYDKSTLETIKKNTAEAVQKAKASRAYVVRVGGSS